MIVNRSHFQFSGVYITTFAQTSAPCETLQRPLYGPEVARGCGEDHPTPTRLERRDGATNSNSFGTKRPPNFVKTVLLKGKEE